VLAAFTGPHAYISPTWYESTSVPTWNYAVVHIYGIPKRMTQSALRDFVGRLATRYEAREREPWNLHYIPSLLDAIVGFEIEITEVQGKFKLSQNRPEADRASVIERLKERGSDSSVATAALMERISRTEKGGA
jgi:transcriptional regulator